MTKKEGGGNSRFTIRFTYCPWEKEAARQILKRDFIKRRSKKKERPEGLGEYSGNYISEWPQNGAHGNDIGIQNLLLGTKPAPLGTQRAQGNYIGSAVDNLKLLVQ